MGKRKSQEGPRKLINSFNTARPQRSQNGSTALPHRHTAAAAAVSHETDYLRQEYTHEGNGHPGTVVFQSPVKQKRKLDITTNQVSTSPSSIITPPETNVFGEQLDAFPTAGQPIIDSTMKDMLITLRGALQHDMSCFMKQTKVEMEALGNRVDQVEFNMTDYAQAHNELIDAHDALLDEMRTMKIKMADLEDRSRRNNITFRGIAESVPAAELRSYLQKMIAELLPDVQGQDLTIDRVHRLPKPSFLPERIPRDVIAKIHFFHVKDRLMQFARQRASLPEPYAGISLYTDLSQATVAARKNLNTITKILRNNNIKYRWKFPTKLEIERNNRTFWISDLDDGLLLLRKWGLLPPGDDEDIADQPSQANN